MIFRNKSVAIIGPAPIQGCQAERIQACDIVVRLNHALPIPPEIAKKTTSRCDVLYTWRKVRPTEQWDSLLQIRLKTDALFKEDFQNWHRRQDYERLKEKVALIEPEHFYGLAKKIGCRPNTGLCAIVEILADQPASLYVTGITFFQNGPAYYDGYLPEDMNEKITASGGNVGKHEQKPQLDYFVREIYPNPTVECSPELDEICRGVIM